MYFSSKTLVEQPCIINYHKKQGALKEQHEHPAGGAVTILESVSVRYQLTL